MRVLHVGLLSSFSMLERLMKEHGRWSQDLAIREQEMVRVRAAAAGGSGADSILAQLTGEVTALKKWIDGVKRYVLCYQTQLADPSLLSLCVRYYRLVSRWLVATAQPPPEGLPLPDEVPRLFASLPEFCMSDVADFLKNLTHLAPQVFEQMAADELFDFVTLMVTFIRWGERRRPPLLALAAAPFPNPRPGPASLPLAPTRPSPSAVTARPSTSRTRTSARRSPSSSATSCPTRTSATPPAAATPPSGSPPSSTRTRSRSAKQININQIH